MNLRKIFTSSILNHQNLKKAFNMGREVEKVLKGIEEKEGEGVIITRSIGSEKGLRNFDPFLLLDQFIGEGAKGFPDHPHRGFEAVTYLLEGSISHEDFTGHKGILHAGDVQWLTAGKGVVHCDVPEYNESSRVRALQLWINLEKNNKMNDAKYQYLKNSNIPRKSCNGVHVKIIAGESMGIRSEIVETLTPTYYLDFKLEKNAEFTQPLPADYNSFVFILEGSGIFGNMKTVVASKGDTLIFKLGDSVNFKNENNEQLHFILLAGKMLNEPIARGGPFVMNTHEEIQQARYDYKNGKNGFENAPNWLSTEMKRRMNSSN